MAVATGGARRTPGSRAVWLVPPALILLTLIPIVSGSLRLTQLSGGPELIPEAARFTSFPAPVMLHIVAMTLAWLPRTPEVAQSAAVMRSASVSACVRLGQSAR